MKRLLITIALLAALLALLVAPPLAAARTLQPTVVMDWAPSPPDGQFAESMAVDSHGTIWTTNTVTGPAIDPEAGLYEPNVGEVWRIKPDGCATRVWHGEITPYAQMMGVAIDARDRVYVAISDFSLLFGLEEPQYGSGVFRLDGHHLARVVSLGGETFPNALAIHQGKLYVTDSALGAVWRVSLSALPASPTKPWLQDELLMPGDNGLGINGVAFLGDCLYAVVYDWGRVVRVPIRADGSAGTVRLLCQDSRLVNGDGIAFDVLGRLWVVTNGSENTPDGSIWRVSRNGSIIAIADDPGWLNYPTTLAFGRTWCTADKLYVLNGAYWDFLDGSAPDLISLPVGVPGLPLR
jgi:sugar lactone lactonase YvrE